MQKAESAQVMMLLKESVQVKNTWQDEDVRKQGRRQIYSISKATASSNWLFRPCPSSWLVDGIYKRTHHLLAERLFRMIKLSEMDGAYFSNQKSRMA
jgi:hypothetical protein